ncbi:TfuA-like protein, partial [Amycolatopsis sp. H20-H5]|uniref:TfuA-like protein n=1 Tax=Amycolatopsis sp. H20-H5 TaxID=3046309 RepID=UPI002DBCF39C
GDLYRLRLANGDAVLIVDGVYQHRAPVRHKEILSLHLDGVAVYGAASIGALRACELDEHGVTGLGTVYGWYRDGRIESDADVALMHGDEDVDFRAFTHALVSVHDVVDRLVLGGELDLAAGAAVTELARSVHFGERSGSRLRSVAREQGLDAPMGTMLAALAGPGGDVKRNDAEAAVRELLATTPTRAVVTESIPDTSYLREWRLHHGPATTAENSPTQRQVLTYAQLFEPDFPERHTAYVLANLRAEHPRVAEKGWLAALSPGELARRKLLTAEETTTLSADERATRVLVRTFRLRSGRLVYEQLPDGLDELVGPCARLLRLNEQATRVNPQFHPADLPPSLVEATFRALWRTGDLDTHLLDRGFRDQEDFLVQARPFFVAAKAATALSAAAEA